ncbi:hypothetical protein ABHI18_011920, partial [Aspergillus niger]
GYWEWDPLPAGELGAGLRGQRRLHLKLSQRVALRPPRSSTPRPPDRHPGMQAIRGGPILRIIASGDAKSPRSGTPWRFRWGHWAAAPITSLRLGSRCSYWLTWRNAVVVCVIIPKEARLADFAPKVGAKASLPGVL